jgi:siderophore synthetase component
MSSLGTSLVFLENLGEVYWPSQGINTIYNWQLSKGYQLKVNADTTLIFEAKTPSGYQIPIEEGWNLIPVLSSEPVEVISVFQENLGSVQIIKEAVGQQVYWPEQSIFTLQNLQPQKAYLLKSEQAFVVSF